MKIKRFYYLPLVLGIFLVSVPNSLAIDLPAIFQNGMVLQQNSEVAVWGTTNPNIKVTVTTGWNRESYNTFSGKNGKWQVDVSTPQGGFNEYEITIEADETVTLENILIGEVWLSSGQSNMAMPVKGYINQPINKSMDILMDAKNPYIRLFEIERNSASKPAPDIKGTWTKSNIHTVKDFSVVAFIFGKQLFEKLEIPIGLIGSYWGGSSVEAWMNAKALDEYPSLDPSLQKNQEKNANRIPSALFNGMIKPIIPYGIKGAIWYQGETNRDRAKEYRSLFPDMIRSWREEWGISDFPFYFVQIAPYSYDGSNMSAFLREAQLKTMQKVSHSGMAVTMDIGEKNNIHPAKKIPVGERLSFWALAKTYGIEGLPYSGPVYQAMDVKDNKVHLSFKYAPNGFTTFDRELTAFEVAGENKKFVPANATISNDKIIVWSEEVNEPKAVRYCFKDWCVGNLYNTAGLPASSFRTDDWNVK
ncbi:sialate O-acetylesterase [Fodinibius roseus]|uniref:Sialate O-acetylesterase n=1 Tax=Fodinibius roseus TaxID=1194090 RepID=A0A1M4ZP03_9BACT|nr:sialate O-acetylesterase [Fodinibius roseus]SHF19779.1 sialate O-acetylesterase [Fodinibius roseus]